jgi:hypothetical protein
MTESTADKAFQIAMNTLWLIAISFIVVAPKLIKLRWFKVVSSSTADNLK